MEAILREKTIQQDLIKLITAPLDFRLIGKYKNTLLLHEAHPELSLKGKIMVLGGSVFFIGSFFWLPLLAWYVWKKKCTTKKKKALTLVLFLGLIYGPLPRRDSVRKWKLWDIFASYFGITVLADGTTPTRGQQYIFAFTPHGVFPFGVALAAIGKMNSKVFHNLKVVIASSIKHMPPIRQVLESIGAVTASRPTVERALKSGDTLGLHPGGIAEMFQGYPSPGFLPHHEAALLKSHKGFVRLALKNGVDLVPVYVFGGSKLYKRAASPLLEKLSRLIGASLMLFWGRWGLPVPFKVPLLFAMGEPIRVAKVPCPTDAEVDRLHGAFCAALQRLFEKYKDFYGWHDKILRIV